MNELQKYIQGKTFEEAEISLKSLGVFMKRHKVFPNLVQFNYDLIESYPNRLNEVSRISRGIILDESNDWSVVCYPFRRFFNMGELETDEINWNDKNLAVYEKVDGSLLSMYFYKRWQVCTRNSPNASGPLNDNVVDSFRNRFWNIFLDAGLSETQFNPECTYMFELTAPENMIVVSHEQSKLTLLGIRNNITEEEYRPEISNIKNLNIVKSFPLRTMSDILNASQNLNPLEQEGYVICDSNFNRVKVKSPKYVALHHMVSEFSPRNCIRLIQMGEDSELFAYHPQYKDKYRNIKDRIELYIRSVQNDYVWVLSNLPDHATQKEYAALAVKTINPGIMFSLRNRQYKTVREAVLSKTVYAIEEYIS